MTCEAKRCGRGCWESFKEGFLLRFLFTDYKKFPLHEVRIAAVETPARRVTPCVLKNARNSLHPYLVPKPFLAKPPAASVILSSRPESWRCAE
jgi:hypothetical protein